MENTATDTLYQHLYACSSQNGANLALHYMKLKADCSYDEWNEIHYELDSAYFEECLDINPVKKDLAYFLATTSVGSISYCSVTVELGGASSITASCQEVSLAAFSSSSTILSGQSYFLGDPDGDFVTMGVFVGFAKEVNDGTALIP